MLSKNISESWIGLTDVENEGRFYWISNNATVTFNYWEKGYPKDNREASDCVLAKRNTGYIFTHIIEIITLIIISIVVYKS